MCLGVKVYDCKRVGWGETRGLGRGVYDRRHLYYRP